MKGISGILLKDIRSNDIKEKVKNKSLSVYDKPYYWEDNGIFLGVSHTNVSLQSLYEEGPVLDRESQLVIIADAIIDNRIDVISRLQLDRKENESISDSQLILKAYKQWGEMCLKYLIGTFSFAIYDIRNKEILLVRDQLGSNKLYYIDNEYFFAFSSNITILLSVFNKKPLLNDIWISHFLITESPLQDVVSEQTIYKDLYQLNAGHLMIYKNNTYIIQQYWKIDIGKRTHMTFEDTCDGLLHSLQTVIKEKIKSNKKVGISLSSGLDSTSVAAITSNILANEGKQLYAYTAVPLKDYKSNSSYYIVNETEYLEPFLSNYPNIIHQSIDSIGMNSITDIDKHLDYFNFPYKFIENYFWIDEIARSAHEQGCNILMEASFGNFTISEGNMLTHLRTLMTNKNYFRIITEIDRYCKHKGCNSKSYYQYYLKELIKGEFFANKDKVINYDNIPINRDLSKRLRIEEIQKELNIGQYVKENMDAYDFQKFCTSPSLLSQITMLHSSFYDEYNIQHVDPTMDIRIIEYCFSIQYNYYVHYGKERQLIRSTMEGLLPDNIRLNYSRRGLQSADWIHRLKPYIKHIQMELNLLLQEDIVQYYLDKDTLSKDLENLDIAVDKQDSKKVRKLIISLIFAKFLMKYQEM